MLSQKLKYILLTILQSFFVIMPVYLIVPLSFKNEIINLYLSIIIAAYVIIFILIRIIKDIYNNTFPNFLLFLIAFALYYYSIFASNYFSFSLKYFLNTQIIYLNSIFTIYLFINHFIFKDLNTTKLHTHTLKFISKWNYIVILFSFIFILIFVLTVKNKFNIIEIILYSSSFLFAINPLFNKNQINLLQKKTQIILKKIGINVSFLQIGLINTIKTFVFSRFGFIGKQQYALSNIEHRKTLRKNSVLNIAASVSKLWNTDFYNTFIKAVTDASELEFTIIEKSKNGIIVENESYGRLIFGFYSFISKYIDERNTHKLYLIKNELTIAKFTIREKIKENNIKIADIFNQYGNTVLINDNEIIEFNTNISIFDKTYNCKNIEEENEILQKLNSKAPTAFFTNNEHSINKQDLVFVNENDKNIAEKLQISLETNTIYLFKNELDKLEDLIKLSKKIDSRINYSLMFFVLLNSVLLIFTVFFYRQPALIMLLNLTLSVIYTLCFKYLPIKINKLGASSRAMS